MPSDCYTCNDIGNERVRHSTDGWMDGWKEGEMRAVTEGSEGGKERRGGREEGGRDGRV